MRCKKCAVLDDSCGVQGWVNLDVARRREWVRRRFFGSIGRVRWRRGDCSTLVNVGGGDISSGLGTGGRSDGSEECRRGTCRWCSRPRSRRRRFVRLQDRAPFGDRLLAKFARALIAAVSGSGRVQRRADDGPVDPDFAEEVREDDGVVVGGEEAATLVFCHALNAWVSANFQRSTGR